MCYCVGKVGWGQASVRRLSVFPDMQHACSHSTTAARRDAPCLSNCLQASAALDGNSTAANASGTVLSSPAPSARSAAVAPAASLLLTVVVAPLLIVAAAALL